MHKAICTVCGQAYGGFAAHSLTKTEAKAATYTETGNNEYYTCSVCQKVFKDAAGTQETTVEAETIAKLTRPSSGGSSSHGDRDPSYAVTAPSTKNGDVTVSPKNASKGDRVTITVTSDKGYELDKLIVKDASGNKPKLTDKGNGKYTFTMPGSKVTVSAEFVEEQAASIFADVPADAYYAKAVECAVKKGITNGKANGLFGSNDSCTRAQIVTCGAPPVLLLPRVRLRFLLTYSLAATAMTQWHGRWKTVSSTAWLTAPSGLTTPAPAARA